MPKGYTHCVHLSVFLDITLHFISSTLGDIVNVNVKQTWYQCFSFSITRTSSSLVLVPFFSCQMVMRMLVMRQLLCGGEYISNIHLRLSNFVVYHIFTTWWPFDVSVSFGIYIVFDTFWSISQIGSTMVSTCTYVCYWEYVLCQLTKS